MLPFSYGVRHMGGGGGGGGIGQAPNAFKANPDILNKYEHMEGWLQIYIGHRVSGRNENRGDILDNALLRPWRCGSIESHSINSVGYEGVLGNYWNGHLDFSETWDMI
eukprot:193478_1